MAVSIRSRIPLTADLRAAVQQRLERQFARCAQWVRRVTVDFEDRSGIRTATDIRCHLVAALQSLPDAHAEARGKTAAAAFGKGVAALARAVQGSVDAAAAAAGAVQSSLARSRDDGLIGRGVGRSRANLDATLAHRRRGRRDAYVDTATPGTAASDRKAGFGSTAARNTKRNTGGMTVALEDSRTAPSRKLSRRSKNRIKAAPQLTKTTKLAVHAPQREARRAAARRGAPPSSLPNRKDAR